MRSVDLHYFTIDDMIKATRKGGQHLNQSGAYHNDVGWIIETKTPILPSRSRWTIWRKVRNVPHLSCVTCDIIYIRNNEGGYMKVVIIGAVSAVLSVVIWAGYLVHRSDSVADRYFSSEDMPIKWGWR